MSSTINPRQKIIESIISLNRSILKDFIALKLKFQSTHIPNSEISNTLKTWKSTFQESVEKHMNDVRLLFTLKNPVVKFDHSILVKELTKMYGNDQQYIEVIKCLNSTTDMVKDYIRTKAIKDPTTAVTEKQLASNQTVLVGSAQSIQV